MAMQRMHRKWTRELVGTAPHFAGLCKRALCRKHGIQKQHSAVLLRLRCQKKSQQTSESPANETICANSSSSAHTRARYIFDFTIVKHHHKSYIRSRWPHMNLVTLKLAKTSTRTSESSSGRSGDFGVSEGPSGG